MSEINKLMDSV